MVEDSELSKSEAGTISSIMLGLSLLVVLLLVGLTCVIVWAGWTEKSFILTTGLASFGWMGLKIAKTYFANLSANLRTDLRNFDGEDRNSEAEDSELDLRSPRTYVLLLVGGLFPALFWYGVGYGLGALFR
ncbi:hypothetical protein [Parvularcula maris]|uniref:Uncharacterized protein n=1 Tax=Parvularcula maris TaxID=2965077 RepID=A0A9X2L8G3_9PROT|nr:hypothetical protein [Parvularcula maris]MCQ8185044.1 hypothetical protein [Parvularcula maris]